jgi:hypothetical protein
VEIAMSPFKIKQVLSTLMWIVVILLIAILVNLLILLFLLFLLSLCYHWLLTHFFIGTLPAPSSTCGSYTNVSTCIADSSCFWCGNSSMGLQEFCLSSAPYSQFPCWAFTVSMYLMKHRK